MAHSYRKIEAILGRKVCDNRKESMTAAGRRLITLHSGRRENRREVGSGSRP